MHYQGIWEQKAGPAWQARHGLTADQYQQAFNEFAKQGYRLIHVYGYSDGGSCNTPWSIIQGHNGGVGGAFSDLFLLPNGMSFALIANQEAPVNGFCTPVARAGSAQPKKVACGGAKQPPCADEPLARLVEVLGKVSWPGYDLF